MVDLVLSVIGVVKGVLNLLSKGQGPVHLLMSDFGGLGILL